MSDHLITEGQLAEVVADISGKVVKTKPQTLTDSQKGIARNNIGAASRAELSLKADKTSLATTDRKLDALWKLNEGKTYDFETVTDEFVTDIVPSGAHLGDLLKVEGNSIYNEGEILNNKADSIKSVGFNLFDKNSENIRTGYYLKSNGTSASISNSIISDYIEVLPNTQYYFNDLTDSNVARYVCWYDNTKAFISSRQVEPIGFLSIAPNNAKYVRASIYTNKLDSACISVSNESLNGQYKEFRTPVIYPFPVAILTGTPEGGTTPEVMFPDGMLRTADGTTYDELDPVGRAVKRCTITEGEIVALATPINYTFPPIDSLIAVEGGGTLAFEQDGDIPVPVPNSIKYAVKLSEV